MPGGCLYAAQTMQPLLRDGEAPNSAALAVDFGSGWLQIWPLNNLPCFLNHWKHGYTSDHHQLLWRTAHGRMALQYVHRYTYMHTHKYIHLYIYFLRKKCGLSALCRLLTDGLGLGTVLWHKSSPTSGRVRHIPPLCSIQPLPCRLEGKLVMRAPVPW